MTRALDAERMPAVLTPAMLAERWQCSEPHVRKMLEDGVLPSFRLGGKLLRVRAEDVMRFECQSGGSQDSEEGSPSPSTTAENVADIRSAPMIRAKLSGLRQRSLRN